MLNLFLKQYHGPTQGSLHFPEFDLIRKTYIKELIAINTYYHTRVFAAKNGHLLEHILNSLAVPMEFNNYKYVEIAQVRALALTKTNNLTHSTNFGSVHYGTFYGSGCDEILLYDDSDFDIEYAIKNWKDISPVRVLWHPKSDLRLLLPNGKKSGTETGLAVISINIAMLALQYKQFCLEQIILYRTSGSLLGINNFLYMYVFPNMMSSHIDIVIINRLMNLFYGKPMGEGLFKHAFNIVDYSNKIDRVLENSLSRIKTETEYFTTMLRNIPCIVETTSLDALELPDTAPTRQVWWALVISRLPVIKFLLDAASERSLGNNMTDINAIKNTLRVLKKSNVLPSVLPTNLLYDTNEMIEDILKK